MERAIERAARLKLMAFDVDGVLTDGTIWFTAEGDVMKGFSTLDGHGLKMLQQSGIELAIITGRRSRALEQRCENLQIKRLYQGVEDKRAVLHELLRELGLDADEAGYMGDDVVDLPILRACGFSATTADGHTLVRAHVDMVASRPGGRGAAREVCDFILAAQNKLDALHARYLAD
ncbi:HAD family hydrolase [Niveibacterium umoris]|uniref:3-deoxy-D-manno-octulosonate 8-phosphate phosphatase KdsC n=1 Tax=Niveibacterium umoris TaxID=1193620 RepID=A0A840BPJ2_9RHOO|nr:HAD hydrolase-like protein [Niveibacterium umoris]MBB4012766.1 3-deoxy-D-manno-octulosonate 8-phosphate phosphatase (KDO 8-P phosphatase) [Niveibacterium umoris]